MWFWKDRVPESLRKRLVSAHTRAIEFLRGWVSRKRKTSRLISFNGPYVLECLVRAGERASARRLIDRICEMQNADGSWSVYGAHRPTSFNTALCLKALLHAREAGIELAGSPYRGVSVNDCIRQARAAAARIAARLSG